MQSAAEIVRNLDDRTAVRFLESFGQRLFSDLRAYELRGAVPDTWARRPHFSRLQHLGKDERGVRLSHASSAKLAKAVLSYLAQQQGVGELLAKAWSSYHDDTLGGEATLSTGFTEGLVTLVAADGIQGDLGGRRFEKRAGDVEFVETLAASAFDEKEARALSPVEFTCFHPTQACPERWYSLPAYAHLPEARMAVEEDGKQRLAGLGGGAQGSNANRNFYLKQGAELSVVPELPGFRFNPPVARFLWLEDWHCAEFRMQTSAKVDGYAPNRAVNGRISYYVGPVLVGEVNIWAHVSPKPEDAEKEVAPETSSSVMHHAVFPSYSHKDTSIVERLESAYEALGLQYLRDVRVLRSGQDWNKELLRKIEAADLFQLCWSENANQSTYVDQEWRHALSLGRPEFVRPTFWGEPMPEPPEELKHLHFSRLSLT